MSFCEAIPDMHHLAGSRAGRVHPLWRDHASKAGNIPDGLLEHLARSLGGPLIEPSSLFAYVAAVVSHPNYTETFRSDLIHSTEIRVPLTADRSLFDIAVGLGREVLWLHTYGKRFAAPGATPHPPRVMPRGSGPSVTTALPQQAHDLSHDHHRDVLVISGMTNNKPHDGEISNVSAAVYGYSVANMNVIESWFGYRKAEPAGKRSSGLDDINPSAWPPAYTASLVDLLHVLTLLIDMHPRQQQGLDAILAGPLITHSQLAATNCLPLRTGHRPQASCLCPVRTAAALGLSATEVGAVIRMPERSTTTTVCSPRVRPGVKLPERIQQHPFFESRSVSPQHLVVAGVVGRRSLAITLATTS